MPAEHVEIKELIEKQGKAWNEFKDVNDKALAKAETTLKNHDATLGEYKETLEKISKDLDETGKQLDEHAKKMASMSINDGLSVDDVKQAALDLKYFNDTRRIVVAGSTAVDPAALKAYNEAFETFCRKGKENLSMEQHKAMSVGSDSNGGYLVTPDTTGRLVKRLYETSDVRSVAGQQEISTDSLEGFNDLGEGAGGWVSEQGARPATATPTLGKWSIPVHELYAMPEATQKLLDDARLDVGAWLAEKTANKFMRIENAAFINGDGVGKPRGFLAYTIATTADSARAWGTLQSVKTGTSGGFGTAPNGSDKLIDLVHTIKTQYRTGSVFAMSRASVGEVRKLKDADGNYLWLPSMTANQPATLLGYGIKEWEDMPTIGANSYSIAFGNFGEAYLIVDRAGVRVIRDDLTNKPFIRFYTVRRVGGGLINSEALKLLQFAT